MKGKKVCKFKSEVKELLQLMIHSLYSNKEIFLRELISNSSDAIDKLRFKALSEPDLYENDPDFKIKIDIEKDKKILKIIDNGIGMTKEEIINNLGTIAKSGTKKFLKSLKQKDIKDNKLIGQFGVGFYSSFIVANKVKVKTRFAGTKHNEGILWESLGTGEYTIENIIKIKRGTEICLYLRDENTEFLDEFRLKSIINKYSNYISFPIEIKNKNEKDNTFFWKKINQGQALWTKNKNEISQKEYIEFYKNLFFDSSNPLTWSHNRVEGKQEYISLLYIPSQAPFDLWNQNKINGLKIYINKVYIMDDIKQFIPNYLRFIRGVIDSNDLPLNISREILQDNSITQILKNSLTKRILNVLEQLSLTDKEKYHQFWKEFGIIFKEGIAEDIINKKTIIKLMRFASTYNKNNLQKTSLEEYINRMQDKQKNIYYITSDSYTAAKNSPHLEIYLNNKIEVLLLYDRIDEWMINYIPEFNGKKLQSIAKYDKELDNLTFNKNEKNQTTPENLEIFIKNIKNVLKDKVKDVKITYKLLNSPAIVTTDSNEITTQMEKLFKSVGQSTPEIKYIFEINPNHKLVKKIMQIKETEIFSNFVKLLLEESLLIERGTLENPNKFINRINNLLS